MIIGLGIDIVEVYRIRDTIARTPRFLARVYTAGEREYCESKGKAAAQSFAARFAAKEAFLKALRTGWRGKLAWDEIEVVVDEGGSPRLSVKGAAARVLAETGADRVHLSISHTSEHAIAEVILEGPPL
jgi:holo-[acyl-carrier protein] synthase